MKRNRLLYALFFFTNLICIYFFGGKVPYMLFSVALIMPVFSMLYLLLVYYRFKYNQSLDRDTVIKGEKIKLSVSINNEDFFLFPYVTVSFNGGKNVFSDQLYERSFSLSPIKKNIFDFELECKYRGRYPVGIDYVEFEDFLGIFKLSYEISQTKMVTVYPRLIKLDKFRLKANMLSENQSNSTSCIEDMTTISDIRKYSYGDSYKRVHWKLSAKLNELMVKTYHSTSQTAATIFIDLKKSSHPLSISAPLEDKLVESAISVIHFCLSNWIPVNMVFYKDTICSIDAKAPFEFEKLYGILASIEFNSSIDIKDIMQIYLLDVITKNNVLVFTSNLDSELYGQIYKTRSAGFEISAFYISPEDITLNKDTATENIVSALPEMGVDTYKININDDIKNILER